MTFSRLFLDEVKTQLVQPEEKPNEEAPKTEKKVVIHYEKK
jgi:hypothetical protein